MEWLWAVLGWPIGWLLNAIVHELPRSHRLFARPACVACERVLRPRALSVLPFPDGGRCAHCGTVSVTWPSTLEWPTALLFGLLAYRYGWSSALVIYSIFAVVLLVVLAIDLRHRWVYGVICYPGIVLALALSILIPEGLVSALLGALAGGALFFALYWIGRLAYRGEEPMGSGDITIATLIGAMVGLQRVLPALFLGGVLVAVASLVLLATRRAGARTFIPYGAGLCAGALAVLVLPGDG
jgi:leader peptidase (prepilin peptidase) / N-methyltransferase